MSKLQTELAAILKPFVERQEYLMDEIQQLRAATDVANRTAQAAHQSAHPAAPQRRTTTERKPVVDPRIEAPAPDSWPELGDAKYVAHDFYPESKTVRIELVTSASSGKGVKISFKDGSPKNSLWLATLTPDGTSHRDKAVERLLSLAEACKQAANDIKFPVPGVPQQEHAIQSKRVVPF